MAALTSTVPSRAGTASPGTAVAASDTVAVSQLGSNGALLEILNGGGSVDNMTISDASATPTGAAAAANAPSVTNGTNKIFALHPRMADAITGLITITHSFITTVTYKLFPLG